MGGGSQGFLFFLCLVAMGRVLRVGRILQKPEAHTLSKVIMHVTIPALAVDNLSQHYVGTWEFASLPLIAVGFCTVLGLVAYRLFFREEVRLRGMLMISSLGFGIGQFAYPIIQSSYGQRGLLYAMLFDFGNFLIAFGVAYAYCIYLDEVHQLRDRSQSDASNYVPLESPGIPDPCQASDAGDVYLSEQPPEAFMGERIISFDTVLSAALMETKEGELLMSVIGKRILLRVCTFTPLLALFVGAFFSLTQIQLPDGVHAFCKCLGDANTPLVGLMLGVSLELPMKKEKWGWVAKIMVLRYTIGACFGILVYYSLDFGNHYRPVVVTCMMLPPPLVIIPYAFDFGLDVELAGMVVTTSVTISFVIMWIVNIMVEDGVMT